MKPAIKILLIQLTLVVGFVIFMVAWSIYSSNHYTIFLKSSQSHIDELVDQVLASHVEKYQMPLNDNSEWNETVLYIKKPNVAFEKSCVNTLLQTFSISSIWIFNADGRLIYKVNDTSNKSLNNLLSQIDISETISRERPKNHFFLKTDSSLFEVFSATVVSTFDIKHLSAPQGFLFFIKVWDSTTINQFSKWTSSVIKLDLGTFHDKKIETDDILHVHRQFKDNNGNHVAEITFIRSDPLIREWKTTSNQILLIIIFLGVIYIALTGFLFNRLISRPLLITIKKLSGSEKKNEMLIQNLENRVKERTIQLENVIKELESFSYSISHDLRAPVRIMDNFAKILLEDHSETLNPEGKKILKMIIDNAKNMDRLIDDLLAFSKLNRQEIKPEEIDMEKMVNMVFSELVYHSDKGKIQFRVQPMPLVHGDLAMIRQVWRNLIGNAIKFTSRKPDPEIEIGSYPENNEIIFFIRDNGVGFNMAYVDKIFGVFKRLHSSKDFEGTGVGLAIVQQVIHRHNGRIWAEGKVNEGATFYFTLPDTNG